MTGISLTWLLITTIALFALVIFAPSGPKIAIQQVISIEIYWSGAFLSLVLALFSILLWIWRVDLSTLLGSHYDTFKTDWQSLVSTVFGAFLWILISLWLISKPKRHWLLLSFGYVILMIGLNEASRSQSALLERSYILGSEDEALNLIASIFLGVSIVTLSALYIKHRKLLISKAQNSFNLYPRIKIECNHPTTQAPHCNEQDKTEQKD